MPFDFNNAEPGKDFSLIPAGTLCKVSMFIRPPEPARIGDDPLMTKSQTSDAQYLDAEFTVIYGPFANRKIWQLFTLSGSTDGQKKAGQISASTIRAILESARNVKTDDETEQGRAARTIQSFADLNGLEFACKIGIEKDRTGQYDDKNKILSVITPDNKHYQAVMSGQDNSAGTGAPAWNNHASAQPAAAHATQPTTAKPADNTPAWAK